MRLIRQALRKDISLGGSGGLDQGAMWARPWPALDSPMSWSTSNGREERIESSFESYVEDAYKRNGIVFTCILVRMLAFSEARFIFQQMNDGRPGDLFATDALAALDQPWPSATTGDMLNRLEQFASLAGNGYVTNRTKTGRLRMLRPDWITTVSGVAGDPEASPFDLDSEVLGYIYGPKNRNGVRKVPPVLLSADEVAHYAPIPDPSAQWRGMSWLTPVLPEIEADTAATRHKLKFFRNGATSNLMITYDKDVGEDDFRAAAKFFREQHEGVDNAYKTIHLGGGADPKTVGADFKQLDFKATQGAGETRIAAASGVGAIIAQFSEGMDGSSLNQGNYAAATRRVADLTIRPLWRNVSGSLAKLVTVPEGARLWYDAEGAAFIKEDAKNAAEISQAQATTIRTYVEAGFTADSSVAAVMAGNPKLLVHTGRLSVQLQDPGTAPSPDTGGTP